MIEQINKGPKLPIKAILATLDATGAYTNIPQDDETKCMEEALDDTLKSKFIVNLMELLLKHSLFEFHSATWRQEIGTAMRVHPAPSYANIYLARRIDKYITDLSKN